MFTRIAGEDRQISLEEFKSVLKVTKVSELRYSHLNTELHDKLLKICLFLQDSFFAERFFTLFDEDKSGTISLRELINSVTILTQGSQEDKLKFLFRVYDVDGIVRM